MTLYDDNDKTARILKRFDERISDLEGSAGSEKTPRLTPSAQDELRTADAITSVVQHTPAPLKWDDETGGGWDIDTWSA